MPTADLVALVERVGSERLGICLDPANAVAGLELPQDVVERCAPLTRNIHVKDFAFARQDGWVGFTYGGAPLGEGLHDYPRLLATVDARASAASTRSSSTGCPGRATPTPPSRPSSPGPTPHWTT